MAGIIPTLQRLFLIVLRRWFRRSPKSTKSLTYSFAFKPKVRVSHCVGTLLECAWLAAEWQNYGIVFFGGDVLTAFDSAKHADMACAEVDRGIPLNMVAALHRERLTTTCAAQNPSFGRTGAVRFDKAGVQGGPQTPDEWRWLLEYIVAPLQAKWTQCGWGSACMKKLHRSTV